MVVRKSFLSRIASGIRAFRIVGSSGGGLASWFFRSLHAGTTVDYDQQTGRKYDNSVVSAGASYIWRQSIYLRLIVRTKGKGDLGETLWTEIENHPAAVAFETPILFDRTQLLFGVILSMIVTGNAYLRKIRSTAGTVVGFAYLPHQLVEPRNDRFNESGIQLVTYYRYFPPGAGQHEDIPTSEVVHFRHGVDPERLGMGLSPLYAALRSVYGENEAATLSAALLRNAGMTSLIMSPKEGAATFESPDAERRFSEKYRFNRISDGAGEPVVVPFAVDVTNVGFSPDKMALTETRALDVSRICAALGMDPMVLGLPSDAKRFANFEEAVEATYEGTIAPLLEVIAIQFDAQCLFVDFERDGFGRLSVGWDESRVPARQEDQDALFSRVGKAYRQDDLVKKNEARRMLGLGPVPDGDKFYSDAVAERMDAAKPVTVAPAKQKAIARRWKEEHGDGGIDSDEPEEL